MGLVPLLARRLAAPAAHARIEAPERRREAWAGLVRPDRGRELFAGVLKVALRRPGGWLAGVAGAVLLTVIVAVPWVLVSTATQEPPEADEVRLGVELLQGESLEAAEDIFARLEAAVLEISRVSKVQSIVQEEGGSSPSVWRPGPSVPTTPTQHESGGGPGCRGGACAVSSCAATQSEGGVGAPSGAGLLLVRGPAEVVLSGPDASDSRIWPRRSRAGWSRFRRWARLESPRDRLRTRSG